MSSIYPIFVYGSLRSDFPGEAHRYISQYFTFLSTAKAKGMLFDLGNYPAAIPTQENNFIVGELYKIKNEAEFNVGMAQLDDYEGLLVEADETPLYRRELTLVFLEGSFTKAWIYWYNETIENTTCIVSGDILEHLKQLN